MIFKICPCACLYPQYVLFCCQVVFHGLALLCSISIHSPGDRHLSCFWPWAITNKAAVKERTFVVWMCVLFFLGQYLAGEWLVAWLAYASLCWKQPQCFSKRMCHLAFHHQYVCVGMVCPFFLLFFSISIYFVEKQR